MILNIIINYVCVENLLFLIFSFTLLTSSLCIILSNNSIYSVLFLVLSFISASGLLFLLECEFIALLFLIIYVGAIAVLFLFVIMMLDIKIIESPKDVWKYLPIGSVLGGFFLIEVFFLINSNIIANPYSLSEVGNEFNNFYVNWYGMIDYITDIKALGQVLYTHYVLQLLIVGLILLLAVIGAVVLTMTNSSIKLKKQVLFKQVSRNYKNILLI